MIGPPPLTFNEQRLRWESKKQPWDFQTLIIWLNSQKSRTSRLFTMMIDAYKMEVSVKNLSLLSFRVTFLLGIIFFQGLQWIETCVPNLNFKSLLTYNANFWNLRSFSSFCSDNQKSDTQTCWYTWQLIRFPGSQMVRTWLDAVVFL